MKLIQEGEIVQVGIGFPNPINEHKTGMVLDRRIENGIPHYFCLILEDNETYVDAILDEGKDVLYSTLKLAVDHARFPCMKRIAQYMGYTN